MTLGVTFPENEDKIDFGWKNEMLVLLVTKLGIYIKLGNYYGNLLRKCTLWKQADFTKCGNICGQLVALFDMALLKKMNILFE